MKATVIKIGSIDDNNQPLGFSLDCRRVVPGIEVKESGEILYGGWTVKELAEMADNNKNEVIS